jgi:hypothetical protein
MRDEIRRKRHPIVSRATGKWNDNPIDKFINEHAWGLEDLVVRKRFEKIAEKEYRLMATET